MPPREIVSPSLFAFHPSSEEEVLPLEEEAVVDLLVEEVVVGLPFMD